MGMDDHRKGRQSLHLREVLEFYSSYVKHDIFFILVACSSDSQPQQPSQLASGRLQGSDEACGRVQRGGVSVQRTGEGENPPTTATSG